jgi:rod shape-determining protein MreB
VLKNNYGLDMGAEFTRLYSLVGENSEIRLEEPTLLLYNEYGELKAFGQDAKDHYGKTPPFFYFQKPVDESGIHQFEFAHVFLDQFFTKNRILKGWRKPFICVNSPIGSTPVQIQAGIELLEDLGFAQVFTLPSPVGAAIGSGLDLRDMRGNLIVILGASHTEIAVVSLFKIVSGKHLQIGMKDVYQQLVLFLRENHGLETSERMAEELVKEYMVLSGDDSSDQDKDFFAVGIDLTTHLPKKVKLKSSLLFEIAKPFFKKIVLSLQEVFETVGPEIVKDILERGVIFVGGGSKIQGLSEYFEKKTTMRLLIPPNASDCIALGNWIYIDALIRKELPANLFPKGR